MSSSLTFENEFMATELPDYANPPVIEVACGVLFSPVPNFTIPYLGRLWSRFPSEFTKPQEAPPLPPVIENFSDAPVFFHSDAFEIPRVWFINDSNDRLIQVQRDRFLCNWRKISETHVYPRYENVMENFEDRLGEFISFSKEELGQTPEFRQYELSYINHILGGEGWKSLSEIGKVLPDLSWRNDKERFLPQPESIESRLTFVLPNKCGRLRVTIRSGTKAPDNVPVIVLDMTARGFLPNRKEWFDIAREWIVRGFTDATGVNVQQSVWGRRR
jgi:uncharacterized protein (TIGR04255 family)